MEDDSDETLLHIYIPKSSKRNRGAETKSVECLFPSKKVTVRAIAAILFVALLVTVIVLGILLAKAHHDKSLHGSRTHDDESGRKHLGWYNIYCHIL